ncbi:hypothetical protein BJY00DRAFT_244866 [Aspergillus carlsbadensis]|nr:hypothetical protein BJY00DRAFT_244866 [Aspergillus carlsbadensis]
MACELFILSVWGLGLAHLHSSPARGSLYQHVLYSWTLSTIITPMYHPLYRRVSLTVQLDVCGHARERVRYLVGSSMADIINGFKQAIKTYVSHSTMWKWPTEWLTGSRATRKDRPSRRVILTDAWDAREVGIIKTRKLLP